ncbi:kinase-like domain-containing protein [Roridomyces roridus]|uniref:Kinase-like domain-containing protein n=1 Tax=Roridomyces roridus TaxID=1738132 RepID=A0AAD7FCC7_9AGAR|nr:kinase-like domain-containing protein [Roridomyces roridus]
MATPRMAPCKYRTGKLLGKGTYAIVREAIHIATEDRFACKIINKKLIEGREYLVRNEIAVLKRISSQHTNIVSLRDYFETPNNLYLCFDLCTGGELFDRICSKGSYYESEAAALVRTIFTAIAHIHAANIVHRDLKPENLLFRTEEEDADIMIADFGLSRIIEEGKLDQLTEICGTLGYMSPEVYQGGPQGKPVDVWAMGVVTYFLLAGYTPFEGENSEAEKQAIIKGVFSFTPEEYWVNVSETARDFVRACLTIDPALRPTAEQALQHQWLATPTPYFVQDSASGGPVDLLPQVKKAAFDAKLAWKKAGATVRAVHRMSLGLQIRNEKAAAAAKIEEYKKESEQESEVVQETLQILPSP